MSTLRNFRPVTATAVLLLLASTPAFASSKGATPQEAIRQPGVSVGDVTITEPAAGHATATFTLSLSGAATRSTSISYVVEALSASASGASRDFTGGSGNVDVRPLQTEAQIRVPVHADRATEAVERFRVRLISATGALLADSAGIGTIRNYETGLRVGDVTVVEPGPGGHASAVVPVTFPPVRGATRLTWRTVDRTAVSTAGDYAGQSATKVLSKGQNSILLQVPVLGDSTAEIAETFSVAVTICPAGSPAQSGKGKVTIEAGIDVPTFAPLPAAADRPIGTPEEAATALAATITAGGPSAVPALRRGLEDSAVPLIAAETVVNTAPAAGVGFGTWELGQLIPRADAQPIRLGDLAAALTGSDATGELSIDSISAVLLQSLRDAQSSPHASVSFWGHFVRALGRSAGYEDVSDATTRPAAVRLSALQADLLTRRIGTEILAVVPAAVRSNNRHAGATTAPATPAAPPCRFNDVQSLAVGYAEVGISASLSKLLEKLAGESAEGTLEALGRVQLALDAVKLVYAFAKLEGQWSGNKVQRTKSTTTHGETMPLSLRVTSAAGGEEGINCARLAFAHLGLTFSLQAGGPLTGGDVYWEGQHGFGSIVHFNVPDGQTLRTKLQNGAASMPVEGIKQSREISPIAKEVEKSATARVCVRLTAPDLFSDIPSLIDDALGPLGIVFSLLERSCLITLSHTFVVSDWERIDKLSGTITWTDLYEENECCSPAEKGRGGWRKNATTGTYEVSLEQNERNEWVNDGTSTYDVSHHYSSFAPYGHLGTRCSVTTTSKGTGSGSIPEQIGGPLRVVKAPPNRLALISGLVGELGEHHVSHAYASTNESADECPTNREYNAKGVQVIPHSPPVCRPERVDYAHGLVGEPELTSDGVYFIDFDCTETRKDPAGIWTLTNEVKGTLRFNSD